MPTERPVTYESVNASLYARAVSPAIMPLPRRFSTPMPCTWPMMSSSTKRFSPFTSTSLPPTVPSSSAAWSSAERYRYSKPWLGWSSFFHATLNLGLSSSTSPMRAPELHAR